MASGNLDTGYAGRRLITALKGDGTADNLRMTDDRMKGYDLDTAGLSYVLSAVEPPRPAASIH